MEFYFSDANLPYDKYLFTLSRKDPEGWVSLDILSSFTRMRDFKAKLGVDRIASIMRNSDLVQVNSGGDRIKRAKELVPQKDQYERSVYAKGFPEETPTLQAELEAWFAQFGHIASVRMRRDQNVKAKKPPFKGSVFVEFVNFEELKAFISKGQSENEEERPKYGETTLKIMSKDDYCKMKMQEKGIDPSTAHRSGKQSANAKSIRFNAFKEMEREARGLPSALSGEVSSKKPAKAEKVDPAERAKQAKENRSKPLEFDFNGIKVTTKPDGTLEEEGLVFPEKSVLAFTGAGEGGNWKDLKETLMSIHPTAFVEFPQGAVEGAVGFKSTLSDDSLAEIISRNIMVGGKEVTWNRVDEERARKFYMDRGNFRAKYLLDLREEREAGGGNADGRGHHGGGHGSGRGKGPNRGGRGGNSSRGRGNHRGQRGGDGGKRKREDGADNNRADAPPEIGSAKKIKSETKAE